MLNLCCHSFIGLLLLGSKRPYGGCSPAQSKIEYGFQHTDDPFYVFDVGQVRKKYDEWMSVFPRVDPFYAVKCNYNHVLLKTLADLGCNFDCASKGEIDKILALGVASSRIIYAHPSKPISHVRHAASKEVSLMTFDKEDELHKIQRWHPNARLVLRIAVFDKTAFSQLSLRYGCDPESEAQLLLEKASALGLNVVGISFHVGTGSRDPTSFVNGISQAHRLFSLGKQLGHQMTILDIGGGFPAGKQSDEITVRKIAIVVNKAIAEYFPVSSKVRIIAEPGRFFCASAFHLCTSIISKKSLPEGAITGCETEKGKQGFAYCMNDGMYGSFADPLGNPDPEVKPLFDKQTAMETWCRISGPTLSVLDVIYESIRMPELNIGDWLLFENMGAYTMALAAEFNGFTLPDIYYLLPNDQSKLSLE